jgi:hypothetical protein
MGATHRRDDPKQLLALATASPVIVFPDNSRSVAGAGKNLLSFSVREKAQMICHGFTSTSVAVYPLSAFSVRFRSSILAHDLQIAIERPNGR